jgi:hypothetical protein
VYNGPNDEGKGQPTYTKVREPAAKQAPKPKEPKTRGKKVQIKAEEKEKIREVKPPKKNKGKEKEKSDSTYDARKNIPCNMKGCKITFWKIKKDKQGKAVMEDGKPVSVEVTCPYKHEGDTKKEPKKESKIGSSMVIPHCINRDRHLVVKVKVNDQWKASGNAVAVGGSILSAKHVVREQNLLERKVDGQLVSAQVSFTNHPDGLDLVSAPKTIAGLQSYKFAAPKVGETVFLVGWDVSDEANPKWHQSTGNVEEAHKDFESVKGHLCHTCTSYAGMSGAMLINVQGQVVGIHSHGKGEVSERNAFVAFTPQMIQDFGSGGWKATH